MSVTATVSIRERMVNVLDAMSEDMIAQLLPMVESFSFRAASENGLSPESDHTVTQTLTSYDMIPFSELSRIWNSSAEDDAWRHL